MLIRFWLILAVTLAAAMACWWLVARYLRRADAQRVRSRLAEDGGVKAKERRAGRPALMQSEDRQTGKIVLRLLERLQLNAKLKRLLEQAGLKWRVARLMHACLALFLAAFVLVWYGAPKLRPWVLAPAVVAGLLPLGYVLRLKKIRIRKFEAEFPESLEFVSRSMRAGHAFSVSLDMLHREFPEPLAGEFRRTFDEHNLGLPLETALQKLAECVPLMDVQFFVSAVLLQKRTGGNLAELLDKLAYVIRERFKLRGRIRAVSAHGHMTGTALSMIPLVVAGMMFFVNREYATFFITDETGRMMAAAAIALQLIGYGVIHKIVSIEV